MYGVGGAEMIQNHRRCDGLKCEKWSLDHIKDGWIVVGDGGFKKYKGRDKTGAAIPDVYVSESKDFCSWNCLRSQTGRA